MRNLADYRNDDGTTPTGNADGQDDTTALRRALAAGPGVVEVGAGTYRWGGVCVPAGVTLVGAGPATVVRSNGAPALFDQRDAGDWAIRDLTLVGNATGDWHQRRDAGHSGVAVTGCWGYELTGLTVRDFDGPGVQLAATRLSRDRAPYCHGGTLTRLTACRNWVGVRFDRRAEYLNATALSVFQNLTGVVIHAGNVKLAASNLCSNVDGLFIEDQENGSHGALANCLINHNERHAIWARRVANGMVFSNCCCFYGDVLLEDCQGVVFADGELCCNLFVRGAGVNRLAGNYVIPHEKICTTFEFTPATLVRDNFTRTGPWEHNRG